MRTKHLFVILLSFIILESCNENDDLTITLKESGTLKIKLMLNSNPVKGTMVYLTPEKNILNKANTSSYIEYAIDFKETDENGMVDFGEINAGNYMIITEGVEVGNLVYNPTRIVQIISGSEKIFSIETSDYKGTINLTVLTYDNISYEYLPTSGIKVAMISKEDLYNTSSIKNAIDNSLLEKTTNANGFVTFELPSGYYYYSIFYTSDIYGEILDYDIYEITYLDIGEEFSRVYSLYF